MEKSETIGKLATALKDFQKEAPAVTKDAKANYGTYATFGNVVETIREKLAEHGLSFSQFPDGDSLTTMLMHESGEWVSATAKLMAEKLTPQSQGSAITYMRRYSLSAVLGIATEDDDDGSAATNAAKPAAKPVSKPAATPTPKGAMKAPKIVEEERQKTEIFSLCNAKALNPLVTKEEYQTYVFDNTGLLLAVENYPAIIERLKAI